MKRNFSMLKLTSQGSAGSDPTKNRTTEKFTDRPLRAAGTSSYVPPFPELRMRAKMPDDVLKSESATIPTAVLKLVVTELLRNCLFDEERYLAAYPDVAKAVTAGTISSAHAHFCMFGYFENRIVIGVFDEDWYLATYRDVAEALRSGKIKSASEHFNTFGLREGRAANGAEAQARKAWDRALGKP